MNHYLTRVGKGSKYIEQAKQGNFVAVGWNEVPDLKNLKTLEEIKQSIKKAYPEYSSSQIAAQAGQLSRFGLEMQPRDLIISPLGDGKYLVGKAGEYYFEDNPSDGCPFKHRRKVKWLDREILKEDMSSNLTYALGATLTIFSLNKYADEISALVKGESITPAEKPQGIRDTIIEKLMELDGKQFEEFIKHLLEVVGFTAEATQYVGDKGIDVNGILNAEGLAEITLRVQVKRVRGTIGNKEILAIRGASARGEHPCLITLSNFSKQAIEESEADGKDPVKIIDADDLAVIILRNFENLDDEYKTLFNIRKKKDFNLEDQFEVIGQDIEEIEESVEGDGKREKREWDTLVCAAKKDGFERVFLGEKAWWAVRLSSKTKDEIKYLAIYQVAPVSKITYYGEVDRIELYKDTGKYKLYLKGEPKKLDNPVGLGKNRHLKPQGPKYAKFEDILNAKTLDDIWGK